LARVAPKVLIMISTSIVGGPGKGLFQFLESVRGNNLDYILCSFSLKNRPKGEFIEQVEKKRLNIQLLYEHFKFDPSLIWQARKLVQEKGINIIQTHGYKENVLGFFLKRISKKPWIGFAHGYTNENAKVRFYNRLDRIALRYPDVVVTVSNRLKNLLIESGVPESKILVIYNAIGKEQLRPDLTPDEVRAKYGIKQGDKIIGVVGRLSPEKGVEVFLQAFKKAINQIPNLRGIIIGDGQEKERLINFCSENGLKDKVIFTGYQNNIANFYQMMDLLVLPSFSEGLPNVVLEAMAFKIPVISTSVGGAPEIITDGQNGLLIPPGNPEIMAEKIIGLMSSDGHLKEIGENGYRSLYPKFSPESRANQILSLYQELLS